jgi:hypothetical protein
MHIGWWEFIVKICLYCGDEHLEGVLFCEGCGQAIHGGVVDATDDMEALEKVSAVIPGSTERFGQDSALAIYVQSASEAIVLQSVKKRIIFGRVDINNAQRPDLDLTPYGALKKGVSRLHAAIGWSEDVLVLTDLGSANGTYLNNHRLGPNEAVVLGCT